VRLLAGQGVTEPTLAQIRNLTGALRPTLDKHEGNTVERVGQGGRLPNRARLQCPHGFHFCQHAVAQRRGINDATPRQIDDACCDDFAVV
jgi:hypothetical protein